MILVVILGAWLAVFLCERAIDDVAIYYLASSLVYSAVAICSFFVWLSGRSRVVFAYMAVNFLAAVFNFLISTPAGYDVYSSMYFVSFQPIAAAVELLALVHGGIDALLFFRSRTNSAMPRGLVRGSGMAEHEAR